MTIGTPYAPHGMSPHHVVKKPVVGDLHQREGYVIPPTAQ